MTIGQFTSEFEIARPQLKSYILRITASVEDTEDIVQDAFIKAAQKLDSFRSDSSVRTWIFAIASNITKDNLRAKKGGLKMLLIFVERKHLQIPTILQK
jgi:RNA polymerase sigma-70 factor (ECF subfamily)